MRSKIVVADPSSRRCFDLAERVARTDVSVLVTGESGTGKEVVARFVHERSGRAAAPFVAINCAAIPGEMLEAILFGHERGAFTGAFQSREGKFEQANGGTLLLDEISEMALSLQAKLLRVLQEREVERVGGRSLIPVDVRVVATTNRDLKAAIAQGSFREDLYYRLSVFPLHLAALRDRPLDVTPLARFFVEKHGHRVPGTATALSDEALAALAGHDWPGNVRELENTIQRALVMAEGGVIRADDLQLPRRDVPAPSGAAATLEARLLEAEVRFVREALAACSGRRAAAARSLGISERTLRHKLKAWREIGISVAA